IIDNKRLIVVGATSALYLDEEHKTRFLDAMSPQYPIYQTAKNMTMMLDLLKESEVNYTYFSPASYFIPNASPTNNYTITGDVYAENARGENLITYEDYAQVVVNFLQSGEYQKAHISIYNN
ncbi:MAG: NAD(P)-dependent oxidoreductase, partial [Streptococcaceae bacterium]|nr:NAD(P)-dependent oxidoreductase [Streptococcaceae bacterium]